VNSVTRLRPTEHLRLDPDPVAAFVRRHQTSLWRFLRVLGCRGQQAEAIATDALALAIEKGLDGEGDAAAAAFVRQTAKHLWLREQRDDRRRAERHAAAAELLWQRDLGADDGAGWLAALDLCLAELPERSRQALDRTYRDGVGRAQLGAELGIGEHGVRSLLQRLRAALRDCIQRRRQP
jgi:RNA polymerase sigma-70 factor (ECF subfamily)